MVRRLLWPVVLAVILFPIMSGLLRASVFVDRPHDVSEPISPIPETATDDSEPEKLGETLFNDPRLSHGNARSCMSCHDIRSNGADARQKDLSPDGLPLHRNTNTVFNTALSFRLDWNGDVRTLQQQAEKSIGDPGFMASTWPELLGKLRADPATVARFRDAMGRAPDREGVLDALAAFERTLVTPNSRFDLWLRGDDTALSSDELEGYHLFKSAGCISCHQGVNIGGNLFEKAGVFQPLLGRDPEMMRVPSLRNVAVTAPYFDDGSAATLDEAVQRMAQAQLGQMLSDQQVGSIVAFLRTLTGRYRGEVLTRPR